MDTDQINQWISTLIDAATDFGLKLIGAIAIWIIGRWLINLSVRLIKNALKSNFDSTLLKYLTSAVSVGLQIILVVAILGFFGVETTSFAALLAAAGVAIGAAWGGLLANFAAGVL